MPTCDWVCPRLVGFLIGELSGRHARAVAAHVRQCTDCRDALSSLHDTVAVVTPPPAPIPPEQQLPPLAGEDVARIRDLVRTGRPRPRRLVWAAAMGAAVLAVLPIAGPRLLWPRSIGKVVRLTGQPQVRLWGRGWRTLAANAPLPTGGYVRTGDTDQLEVQFTDGSRVRLDFGTEVQLTTRTERRQKPSERADLYLQRGRVWLLVTAAQSGLRVHTAAGTAEALGTIFEVSTQSHEAGGTGPYSEAAVNVLRGEVRVSNEQGSVVAGANTMTQAREGQAPTAPRTIAYVDTVRSRAPWTGGTSYEVWVIPPLDVAGAAQRLAGRRGWLGVELASASLTLTGAALPGPGLTITKVAPHAPAAEAGLIAGDRLVRVGDTPLVTRGDLWRTEVLYLPNAKVDLEFRRGHETRRASVTCAEHPLARGLRAESRLEAANRDLVSGRTADARRAYEVLTHTGLTAAVHNLGVIDEMAGDIVPARKHYQEAARRDDRQPRYHFSAALALARRGNLSEAAGELQATLDRAPQYPEVRFLLGRMQGFLGDFAAGEEQVTALRADPDTRAQGLCLAGELKRLQNDPARAIPLYQQAVAAAPLYPDAVTYLGAAYYQVHDLAQAELWIQRALIVDPDSLRALNRLGLIRRDQKRLAEAKALFLRVQELHPGYATVFSNLGGVYYKMGKLREAKQAYHQAIAADPNGADSYVGLAMTLQANHELAAARSQYELAVALDPTYARAYRELAVLDRQLGYAQAARDVEDTARSYGL